MSDEEKIKQLENKIKKLEKENQGLFELYSFKDISLISKVLKDYENTIESQQKEIKELKETYNKLAKECNEENRRCMLLAVENQDLKDKIKTKIEEYKWAVESYDCDDADYKQSQAVGSWNVLQSLLEKE